MVTQAVREGFADQWRTLMSQEEEMGKIPLPALSTVRRYDDRPVTISLVAPGMVPDTNKVFVAVERMPLPVRMAVEAILTMLEMSLQSMLPGLRLGPMPPVASKHGSRLGREGPGLESAPSRLVTILHEGGLGYEFEFNDGLSLRLLTLPEPVQPIVWGLIQALVAIGARYPELPAGSLHSTPASQEGGSRG